MTAEPRLEWVMSRDVPPATQGLKRDAALLALSRDHHGALVQAQRLRRAIQRSSASVAKGYLAYFREELAGHLADEEIVVLPRMEPHEPLGAGRVRAEHKELRALTSGLEKTLGEGGDSTALLEPIGRLIDDHVRFEERTFFMSLQSALSPEDLAELGRALKAHRRARGWAETCSPPPKA